MTKLQRIHEPPNFIEGRYQRLILIADAEQVASFDIDPATDLIVTTNWLLWQRLLGEMRPCVHLDYGLVLSPIEGLSETIFVQSNDWLFRNGDDPTVFHGVSLGRKMMKEISVVISEFERIHGALKALVKKFAVEQIVFLGVRTTQDFLERDECLRIVRQLAEETDRTLTVPERDSEGADFSGLVYQYAEKREGGVQRMPLPTRLFDLATRLHWSVFRHFGKKRPRVLLMHSQLTSIPLLAASDGHPCRPMMLASWYPEKRNLARLIKRLLNGLILVPERHFELSQKDRKRVDDILADARALVDGVGTPREKYVLGYIRRKMLTRRFLETLAKDVLYAEWALTAYRPDAVTTDGLQNTFIQNFLEVAKRDGIRTLSTWHACRVHYEKLEIFGCDPRIPCLVDTVLTWAVTDENWLKVTGAQSSYVRTGHILASHLKDIRRNGLERRASPSNALVLQYTPMYSDFETLSSLEYEFFVAAMTSLTRAGYKNIKFKLHPGHRHVKYYQAIADEFRVDCEVIASGPFKEYVKWADVVVGPAFSGAMLEVISAGKTHLPVLLPPHPIDLSVFCNATVFEDMASVDDVLRSGDFPDQSGLLRDFCSLDDFDDPAATAWQVIADQCNRSAQGLSS